MTRTTKTKTEKAKRAPALDDPALVAAKKAAEAAAAFNAFAGDETSPEWVAVEKRTTEADAAFADAPVTSAAGALAKMRLIVAFDEAPDRSSPKYLTPRHFDTVLAFLEAVAGGTAPAIDNHPDAELLARVAEFYPAREKHNIAAEAWHTRHAEAEAMPDCPPHAAPAFDKAGSDRWNAFMKAKGVFKLSDKSNAAGRAMGKAANRVFAIPAHTYRGAAEKVKIAYLATGDGEGTLTGDADLEAYQEWENPWMKNAIADLVRLTGAPPVVADDPAVAAFEELKAASAVLEAFHALPGTEWGDTPEYDAAYERHAGARDAVRDAVPVSLAGVAGKVRAMLEPYRADVDATGGIHHDYDIAAKAMLPFLEDGPPAGPPTEPDPVVVAFPAPAPKPDPVVTLFAKWAEIRDEATALGNSDPKGSDPEINERWENAIGRCDAVEDQIMETPATTMRGVAIKIRLASHYVLEAGDFDKRYATPARDLDYVGAYGGHLGVDGYVISALLDAERLAGVS